MALIVDTSDLNEAVQLYVGVGLSPFPNEDDSRLVERFGVEGSQALIAQVRSIIAALQSAQPDWDKHTLVSGSKWAVDQVMSKHAALNESSRSALEWIYSWWCK